MAVPAGSFRVTFTIAGRSTRPFNFHPVRSTSPTSRLAVAVVLHHRFVLVRIERRAQRVDRLEPGPLEHAEQLGVHELDALAHLLVDVVAVEVRDRELEAVEHRAAAARRGLRSRALDERGLLAQHALAVVLEVGLQALRRVEQVVALALQRVDVGVELRGFDVGGPARRPSPAPDPRPRSGCIASSCTSCHALCCVVVVDDLGVGDFVVGRRASPAPAPPRRPTAAPARSGTGAS